MRNLLKHADMMVTPYQFNVKIRQKSQTVVGGVLSIVVGIFTIFYMAAVIQYTLQDQETIYLGTQNTNINQNILNSNNTMIALEISDKYGNIFQNVTELQQYFDINIQLVEQIRDSSKIGYTRIKKHISLRKCEPEVINEFNFDLFAISNEKKLNFYCSSGDYAMVGSFFDKDFSYLEVSKSVCSKASNPLWVPIETIKGENLIRC